MSHRADEHASLFRVKPFVLMFTTRVSTTTANQMFGVAAGWHVYEATSSPFLLGLSGLAQFLPPLLLTLYAGQQADFRDRRMILRTCYAVEFCVAISLMILSGASTLWLPMFYGLLFVNAIARTFEGPSLQSLLPLVVPRAILGRAVATNSVAGRLSQLIGPTTGGLLFAWSPQAVYFACASLVLIAGVASNFLPASPPAPIGEGSEKPSMFGGLKFIWSSKPLLGAMSLDLTATLFGGVTALLPIFARDILEIGPWGFGILRSTPALGGLLTALILSRFPLGRRGGWFIFIGMSVYGVGTILFALSNMVALSIFLMFMVGMGDMLSGVTRQTLIQVMAPDDTRGRVIAVNGLFNNTAGQLGAFESGIAAELLGAQGAVLFGGIAVLSVTMLWVRLFPELHSLDWRKQVMGR